MNDDVVFRELLEAIPDTIIIVNQAGKIVVVNGHTEKMFGYKKDELIGQSIEIIIPERFRTRHVDDRMRYQSNPYRRPMASGRDLHALRKDGTEFPADISLSPIKLNDELFVISSVRDITDFKRAQQEIVESAVDAERAKAESEQLELFAYVVSHDLQEPFQNILALNELLELHCGKQIDEKGRNYLERINNATLRISRLISDLLRFSRVTRRQVDFEIVDLNEVLNSVLKDLESLISKSNADIAISRLPEVFSSKIYMHELFLNLVSNAIKFHKSTEPPRVTVTGERLENKAVQIKIQDNGIGFDQDEIENIFKPFVRLKTGKEFEGSGIGLTICQRIVLENSGKISVESAPDKGTLFTVVLPSEPWL
ncbi:MAG: PAS domain S-box protein [Candidatus Omnitrophica bacterium]|nr:PAS domain S-box protein [Candidatus Omnitrophota bacterium]